MLEYQVSGKIDDERQKQKNGKQVQRCGSPRAMEKGVGVNIVDIRWGPCGESCRDQDGNRDAALRTPASAVISQPMQRPQKQKWHDDMK